jgi:subtilisin family serine protease
MKMIKALGNRPNFPRSQDTVPGEIIVKLAQGTQPLDQFESILNAKVVEEFQFPNDTLTSNGPMVRMKLSDGLSVEAALEQLQADDRVEFAEPNRVYTLQEAGNPPNDLNEKLWGLDNTGQTGGTPGADVSAKAAWNITTGNKGPLISVIDSGIDYNHPDLRANMWVNPGEIPGDGIDNDNNGVVDDVHGYNAYADNGDPMDSHSHGTHCAGTIAAVGNNDIGVTGVMQEADLMAVKIFGDNGRTSTDAIVRGILYSSRMGADITSNSWGGREPSDAIYEAFQSHPGLHVVAAGNSAFDNDKKPNYPSNYDLDNILAVAATNHIDQRARFSQWGAKNVDVAAPGRDIWSTIPNGKYGIKSGTSMATPHVTGGAGLILSAYPEASNKEIKQRLIYSSKRLPSMLGVSVSNGRVNFAKSLEDDSIAPAAPNDFDTEKVGIRGGSVSWTSVGDDKWANGAAPVVELWRSAEPLSTDNLASATKHMLEGATEVGDLVTFSFESEPKEASEDIHFAMRSLDDVGNASETRFTTVTVPAAEIALGDDFDSEDVAFQATGDFHRVEEQDRGLVFSSRPGEEGSEPVSELVSREIDLTGKKDAFLKFDFKSDLGWGETAEVYASTDGENWTRESILRRNSNGWREQGSNISEYDGQKIQLKFRVDAKEGKRFGGIRVDNVRLLVGSQD